MVFYGNKCGGEERGGEKKRETHPPPTPDVKAGVCNSDFSYQGPIKTKTEFGGMFSHISMAVQHKSALLVFQTFFNL